MSIGTIDYNGVAWSDIQQIRVHRNSKSIICCSNKVSYVVALNSNVVRFVFHLSLSKEHRGVTF